MGYHLKGEPAQELQYCYWDARSSTDVIIMTCYCSMAFLFLLTIVRYYVRARRHQKPGLAFYVYYLLMAWCISNYL